MSGIITSIIAKADPIDYYGKHTELKSRGNTHRGCCPICSGSNESEFAVYNDGKYHCFKCSSSGTVINFYADLHRVRYDEAIRVLAEEFNLDIKRDQQYVVQMSEVEKNERVVAQYTRQVDKVEAYLIKRGLTEEQIMDFKLGYDGKNLVFPLRDANGRTIAFAVRQFDRKPKYINSKNGDLYDKSKYWYNIDKARKRINNRIILVEGYFDAIAGDSQEPTIAYCGIEISKDQIHALKDLASNNQYLEILWLPDNDGKAIEIVPKVRERFLNIAPGLTVRVGIMPEGVKDLSDYVQSGGKIDNLENEALDMFVLKLLLNNCNSIQAEYKVTEKYMKTVNSPMVRSDIAKYLAQRWDKNEKEMRDWLSVSTKSVDDLLSEFKDPLQCINEYGELLGGEPIGFGFPSLDKALRGGGRKQDVVFLGAYSSVGKTMVVIQMVIDMIIRQNKRVLFFSLEMNAGSLYERIIANLLGKSTQEIEALMKAKDPMIYRIVEKLEKRLFIVDTNHLSIEDMEERIKLANTRLAEEGRIDVVIVDYLQYMANTEDYEKLSKTARYFKPVAKEQNTMFIVLSQLNRGAMAWETPTMNMLKGAGDIEATGDIILFLWKPNLNPKLTAIEKEQLRNQIMLGVGKARRGCLAYEFELAFNEKETRVREAIPEGMSA